MDNDPQAQWDDMKIYGPYARTLSRWIYSLIAPLNFSSVLDVGCGRGHTLRGLTQRYPHLDRVSGIDLSPISLQVAQERVPRGTFHVLDIQTTCLQETFNLVLCTDVIELIRNDEAALLNIRKMTSKYLLITTLQGNFLPEWEVRIGGHVRNYRRGELVAKLKRAGFGITRSMEWGFPFYSPLYRRMLNLFRGNGMSGRYGFPRRLLSEAIFRLFYLNSAKGGELLFVLACPLEAETP